MFKVNNMLTPKLFHFYDKVIVLELFSNNIKTELYCEDLLEEILTLIEKSELTKKLQNGLKMAV